jgi:phosphoribosylglycinamide formyltransferase-1
VHFCTDEYDAGPIIVQRCCDVKEGDTPESLAARVFKEECMAYPEAIKFFQDGRLVVEGQRVRIVENR